MKENLKKNIELAVKRLDFESFEHSAEEEKINFFFGENTTTGAIQENYLFGIEYGSTIDGRTYVSIPKDSLEKEQELETEREGRVNSKISFRQLYDQNFGYTHPTKPKNPIQNDISGDIANRIASFVDSDYSKLSKNNFLERGREAIQVNEEKSLFSKALDCLLSCCKNLLSCCNKDTTDNSLGAEEYYRSSNQPLNNESRSTAWTDQIEEEIELQQSGTSRMAI